MPFVELCGEEVPTFLHFFDLSTRPALLFYTYLPTIVLSLLFGVYVFWKDKKSLASRLLLAISTSFALWVLTILVLWVASYNTILMFAWQMNPLVEILIFVFAIYLTYVFIDPERRDISNKLKGLLMLIVLPVVLLLPTRFNISGYDLVSCEGILGPVWDYMYIFEIISVFWIADICLDKYRQLRRKQILVMMAGMLAFLVLFIGSNVAGEVLERQEISFIGALGMVLFLGFLGYLVIRYKTFNIRVIGANALVLVLWILIGSILFVAVSPLTRIVVAVTEIVAIIFGLILIQSVKKEVRQREEIEELAVGLEAANARLKELDQQKTEFLSLASHQLRAPLTAIKGYSSMLLEGSFGPLAEKARHAVDIVFMSSQKLVMVIEDFLNITRIELGQIKYEMAETDLKKVLEQVATEMGPTAEKRGLALKLNIMPGDYLAKVDSGKISQVFANLIDNAVKYTKEGEVKVQLVKIKDKIRLSVTDTGIGLDKETKAKLFQKYSRAYNASQTNIGGTGLGLYVAKQLVEAHGGKIWAESDGVGKGSTFVVEL